MNLGEGLALYYIVNLSIIIFTSLNWVKVLMLGFTNTLMKLE